jgi:hypothetical protein
MTTFNEIFDWWFFIGPWWLRLLKVAVMVGLYCDALLAGLVIIDEGGRG